MTVTVDHPVETSRPERFPDVIGVIKDRYSGLRPAEQAVADVILSNVEEAVSASNGDIAERAGVSQPTVTRFCRAVGCQGVRDFKLQLARSLAVGEAFLADDAPATPEGELPAFWTSVLTEARAAIREVERQVPPAAVLQAAEALSGAARIATFGIGGSSAALALEAQVRLFRYGLAVQVCQEPHIARMQAATMRPGDVLLVISATGRTTDVLDVVSTAARYGARTIAITRPDTALAGAVDIPLTVGVAEYPDALTPSAARFAFLAVLDVVSAATGYQLGPDARESLRRIKFNLVESGHGPRLEPLGD